MNFSDTQINSIAEYLSDGLLCYVNLITGECKAFEDPDEAETEQQERIEEEIAEATKKWKEFEIMESPSLSEALEIMEDFADRIDDTDLQEELFNLINNDVEIDEFENLIESHSYTEEWKAFMKKRYRMYVRDYLRRSLLDD